MSNMQEALPTEYSELTHLFFYLRGSGVSLSAADLDILSFWEKEGIHPAFIAQVMMDIKEECQIKGKNYPGSFAAVHRRLSSIILKMREH